MKSTANLALWTSAALFALFSAISGARLLYGFDLWALRAAQSPASSLLDALGEFFSSVGGLSISGLALTVLLAWLFLSGRRALSVRLLISFAVASVIEIALKMWLPQVPMPEEFSRSSGHEPLVEFEYPYPYPSGHMLRSVILLGAIFLLWKNRLARVLIVAVVVGMAASRVYMGVHWASDVIGGVLLGLAGLAWAFRERSAVSHQRKAG